MQNRTSILGALALFIAGPATTQAAHANSTLIVTASNLPVNQLLIYSASGALLKQIPTQGQGGVGGNSGGIAQDHDRIAVVNFGSASVSVFTKDLEHSTLHLESVMATNGGPVSVAFGHDHLYVLTTTHIESHRVGAAGVNPSADGVAHLLLGDGSAAQVGVLTGQVVITEKSGDIETVGLTGLGAITGAPTLVANGLNAPFGLATRGNERVRDHCARQRSQPGSQQQDPRRSWLRRSDGTLLGGAGWSIPVLHQFAEPLHLPVRRLWPDHHARCTGGRDL